MPLNRVPYPVPQALDVLSPYEHIILIGAKPPIAFFAYPNQPSELHPEGCQIHRLAELDEPGNPIAANNRRIAAELQAQGMSAGQATEAARYRIFGNAPGEYGTGVPDLAMASTEWDDDAVLAEQFLASNGYAFGSQRWGEASGTTNLLASQLRGTQAAIMSRSSNLHGVLSTDHPFEFLGGLSAAVRQLDGAAPQLLISDLRSSDTRTTGLDRFLADELRVRYLNPQWIEGMQAEGYAGTLEVLNVTNNLFGWQAMDPSTVRDDQWQALFDTYVNDSRELGTRDWFEQHNPTAQAQMLERMAEAIRKDYWDASEQTRAQLAERWQQLQNEFDVAPGNPVTSAFIAELARGAGFEAPASNEPSAALPEQPAAASEADERGERDLRDEARVDVWGVADGGEPHRRHRVCLQWGRGGVRIARRKLRAGELRVSPRRSATSPSPRGPS